MRLFSVTPSLKRRRPPGVSSRAPGDAGPLPPPPADSPIPPPLFALRERLYFAFSLDELRELAFTAGIDPDSVPDDTRQAFALGLARAAWCRGRLESLLAEAAALRPDGDWALDAALPAPPPDGCEDDPLPRPSVFRDSRQVAMFVLLPLIAIALAVAGLRLAGRPRPMTGAFNIAVAGVEVAQAVPGANVAGVAERLQQDVAALLDRELTELGATGVQVSAARMPRLAGDDEAAKLSKRVKAHLIVHGRATVYENGTIAYDPAFYVNLPPGLHGDLIELNGSHVLNAQLPFGPGARPEQTAEGAAVVARFAQALVYLQAGDLQAARETVEDAAARSQAYADQYGEFEGRAVIYLFASHIALLQSVAARAADPAGADSQLQQAERHAEKALALKPEYDRAHIALGNITFQTGQMGPAYRAYEAALHLAQAKPVDTAFVAQKAHLGLGNVLLARLHGLEEAGVDAAEMRPVADEALAHFAAAAALPSRPAELQRTLAGEALANSGHVHALMDDAGAATAAFCDALGYPLRPTPAAGISEALASDGGPERVCEEE